MSLSSRQLKVWQALLHDIFLIPNDGLQRLRQYGLILCGKNNSDWGESLKLIIQFDRILVMSWKLHKYG